LFFAVVGRIALFAVRYVKVDAEGDEYYDAYGAGGCDAGFGACAEAGGERWRWRDGG